MQQYVIIHCQKLDHQGDILFVLKDKPEWQKGRLNLPGGKIEEGETPFEAAERELLEESGYRPVHTPRLMGVLIDGDSEIFCLKVVVPDIHPQPRPEETQKIFWLPWYWADNDPRLIPNLRVIVPLNMAGVENWIIKDEYRSCFDPHHQVQMFLPTRV